MGGGGGGYCSFYPDLEHLILTDHVIVQFSLPLVILNYLVLRDVHKKKLIIGLFRAKLPVDKNIRESWQYRDVHFLFYRS